ncbi:MAG: urea ABC transporter substrate-binding protein [Desulfobulbaceae bacterium]|nr:urea ABC transporter substrate-binding protein [Desulfobulbaceae bacterium]
MKRAIIITWVVFFLAIMLLSFKKEVALPPVQIGVLHSQTGTMAVSEQSVIDATLLAIDQLNLQGGVLGRKVEAIVADGGSDPAEFSRQAQRLIDRERVVALFGCWTSASRKEVKKVVEEANHLLIYPVQYEGVESSPSIIYTGLVPNQQIKPAVKWAMDNIGNRFFLLGSDYIFPHMANTLIRDMADFVDGSVVGERYVLLGSSEFDYIIEEIETTRPAVIFNTLNGDSNFAFFAALKKHGISAADIPVFSFSIAETELQVLSDRLGIEFLVGHYVAGSYFQTLPGIENNDFINLFTDRFGNERRVTDAMVSAYDGVMLWAQAAQESGSVDPTVVCNAFGRQGRNGPGGIIYIDDHNHHAWKSVRIGRINYQGLFDIIWDSQKLIKPEPYPFYRNVNIWQDMENQLYKQWGNNWQNPQGVEH